jgi:two-component system sensor histidine kinase AlgZ
MPFDPASVRKLPLTWRRMLVLNLGVSCGATLILWSFSRGTDALGLLFTFGFCLAFTNAFGIPAAWVMSQMGPLIVDRRPPYNVIVATALILAFTALGTFLGVLALHWLGAEGAGGIWGSFWAGLRFATVVALTVGLGAFFWETKREELESARREIQRRELAEVNTLKLLAEARLASLESRIHPHFLFNTLNSIAALIPEDPQRAELTVQQLATLLRFSLDASHERLVELGQECRVVHDYLEIEKARFGERLRYHIELSPGTQGLLVPPLAVQTLVENAVKHAVATRRAGAEIHVLAMIEGGELVVEVADDGPGFTPQAQLPGHGLENLRERLASLFANQAGVEVRAGRSVGACVRLRLPATASIERPA